LQISSVSAQGDHTTQIIFQQGLGMNGVAFFTVDRLGRHKLFMFGGVGMAACTLALTLASSFLKRNRLAHIASAFFVFLFNFFITIGFLDVNFLYCEDVAPTRLRVPMAGISTR
jgi:hypothetical protein